MLLIIIANLIAFILSAIASGVNACSAPSKTLLVINIVLLFACIAGILTCIYLLTI